MTGHLTKEKIELFRRNELSPAELLTVDDHLIECGDCADLAQKKLMLDDHVSIIESALSASPARSHLTYGQLEGYTSDGLNTVERRQVEHHISDCDECGRELQLLNALSAAIGRKNSGRPEEQNSSLLERLKTLFSSRVLAVTALLGVSAAGVAWMVLRNSAKAPLRNESASIEAITNVDIAPPEIMHSELPENTIELGAKSEDRSSSDEIDGGEDALRLKLTDGGRAVGITAAGKIKGFDGLPPSLLRSIRAALTSGEVELGTDRRELSSSRGILMGPDKSGTSAAFRLKRPVGEVLATDTPRLEWEPLPGAEMYVVEVFDSNFNKIASSGPIKDTSWTTKLQRGRTYAWQVTANRGTEQIKAPQRPAPDSKFKLISQDLHDQILRVRRGRPNQHLALGVLYAKAGLLDDALTEFEALARINPNSPLPRKLVSQIRSEINRQTK